MTKPQIFKTLSNPARAFLSASIPSLATMIGRRALTAEKAQQLYEEAWLLQAAEWTEDEQRDFALGYFMATHEREIVLCCPPSVGAFIPNYADQLPTERRRLAYKAGMAFAQGKGSADAGRIVKGQPFGFGMKPRAAETGKTSFALAALADAAASVATSVTPRGMQ